MGTANRNVLPNITIAEVMHSTAKYGTLNMNIYIEGEFDDND